MCHLVVGDNRYIFVFWHKYQQGCWGTRWRSYLRLCATSRKVAGSISDIVIGLFPSGRPMNLGSTQPLTQISNRNISRWVMRPVRRAGNRATFMCRLSWILEASSSWNLSMPVVGLLYVLSAGLLTEKLSISLEKLFLSLRFSQDNTRYILQNLHLRTHQVSQRNSFPNPTLPCRWWGELNSMKASPGDVCILSARLHFPLSASLVIPRRCSCY